MKNLISVLLISLLFIACANESQTRNYDTGYNKNNYDKNGYDKYGYDRFNFGKDGFNKNGYDRYGYDRYGYNKYGYNRFNFGKDGFNKKGFDKNGYNKNGYDKYGYDKNGYNKNGYDKYGINKLGFNSNGLTKHQIITKNNNKLIKAKSNIKEVYDSLIEKQKKGRYESSLEYKDRIQKNMNTSIVLEIKSKDIIKEYNPDTKEYKLKVWVITPTMNVIRKFNKGILSDDFISFQIYKMIKLNMGDTTFKFEGERNQYTSLGSTAYGVTVKVTHTTETNYFIYPTNINKIIDNSALLGREKDYLTLTLHASKNLAKKYDKEEFILKINANLVDIQNSMYKGAYGRNPTIDYPYDKLIKSYLAKAIINQIIIYNKNTKEILFSKIEAF